MGCIQSGAKARPKACTKEQVAELCNVCAKEMMVLCAEPALQKPDEIKIPPPKEVANMRNDVKNMREFNKDGGDGDGEKKKRSSAKSASKKKGGLGGMLDSAKDAASKVADKAGDLANAGAEKVLGVLADALEQAIDKVEQPFTDVGRDLVKEQSEAILKVFNDYITSMTIADDDVIAIVRGAAPYGKAEYDAVPKDAVSKYLCTKSRDELASKLKPICSEAIKKHTITKTWDTVIDKFNALSEKLKSMSDDVNLVPIQLDIEDYIVSQTIDQIGVLMGKEEEILRASPEGKSRRPQVFEDVYGAKTLDSTVYSKLTPSE
jgi:hypothetical protein